MNELVQPLPKVASSRKTPKSAPATLTTSAETSPLKRTYDADRSMADILEVATAEFAEKGLSGARIDEIASATRTSKRMIYYHFASKEGLYRAVLEHAYRRIREIEAGLNLEDLAPEAALRKLVAFTFDYQQDNESFIRLVMTENIHRGEHLAQCDTIQSLNLPAIDAIRRIYERGVETQVFRPGIDATDLHMSISALCFFGVANRHTFSLIFKTDLTSPEALEMRRNSVVEMIVRFVRK